MIDNDVETVIERAVEIGQRVARNNRVADGEPIPVGLAVAAAAVQLAAGYDEPRAFYTLETARAIGVALEGDVGAPTFDDDQRTAGATIWRLATERLIVELPASASPWLEPLRALGATDSEIWLAGRASVVAWVERRYAHRVQAAIDDVCKEHDRPRRALRLTRTEEE